MYLTTWLRCIKATDNPKPGRVGSRAPRCTSLGPRAAWWTPPRACAPTAPRPVLTQSPLPADSGIWVNRNWGETRGSGQVLFTDRNEMWEEKWPLQPVRYNSTNVSWSYKSSSYQGEKLKAKPVNWGSGKPSVLKGPWAVCVRPGDWGSLRSGTVWSKASRF